jgi:hypothetical protein
MAGQWREGMPFRRHMETAVSPIRQADAAPLLPPIAAMISEIDICAA